MSIYSKNTNIGIRHFRAALALAREQSFARAADALGVVPSALTETIKQLEADCGLRLFDRESRPVTPTEAGEAFLVEARRVVSDFEAALHDLRRVGGIERGSVKVAAAPSVVLFHLAPALKAFRAVHPAVEVSVHDDIAARVGSLVLEREVDFGIAERWHESDQLAYEPFHVDPFVLVCHREHPLAERSRVRLADIPAADVIALDQSTGTGKQIAAAAPAMPPGFLEGRLRAHGTIAQLTMIAQGMGVGLMPELAASVIQSPEIRRIAVEDLALRRTLCIIRRARIGLSPAAERLLDHIRPLGSLASA
ncbi:LysR family transcriptional regulator [Kaistia sp. 32K]|uniref:LysR family transcriptional regulator n=1 Tax=Kaistia sp. 32K TaxID=2795690 RepID=UPI001915663E|nr:LysR substrate-binding domain-containing protein [Kaistia sp. 32K]BCP52053.1 LysR family transcriptional regulator [Kaistia sp. 32K]